MYRRRLLTGLAGVALVAAAEPIPDTPAGRLLAGYIAAFNSGEPETVLNFFKANFPDPNIVYHAANVMTVRDLSGPVDFVAMTKTTDTDVRAKVRARNSDRELVLGVIVDPATPEKIKAVGLWRIEKPKP